MAFTTPKWNETVDSPYAGDGYNSALKILSDQQVQLNSSSPEAEKQLITRLDTIGDQFNSLFTNTVGRAPNTDEINKFFQENAGQTISNTPLGRSETDPQNVRNVVSQYIGDTFQPEAKQEATQQLAAQTNQAQDLASQFRSQGQAAIGSTEQMLQDYQSRLFDRLRPQLLTSLQSQGLLNSGGLNEAISGTQADLAAQAEGFLSNANLNLENQANQIAFGGASAPYYYQQSQIENQVPYLQNQAQSAMNFGNQNYFNNQQYQNAMALERLKQGGQSNQIGQQMAFGSNFTQGFGSQFGGSLGKGWGQYASPGGGMFGDIATAFGA